MLFLISSEIHPNSGSIDLYSTVTRCVTWGNRLVQCANCSFSVHLSCSGLSSAKFRKISSGDSWTCPKFSSSSRTFPSPSQTVSLSLSSKTFKNEKSSSLKRTPRKNPSTINNFSNLAYHPY